jgi:hypothetical protein
MVSLPSPPLSYWEPWHPPSGASFLGDINCRNTAQCFAIGVTAIGIVRAARLRSQTAIIDGEAGADPRPGSLAAVWALQLPQFKQFLNLCESQIVLRGKPANLSAERIPISLLL